MSLKESKRNRRREREREHTPHPPDFSQISGPGALALPRLPSCGDWQPALQRTTRTGNSAGPQLGAGKLAHRRLRTAGNLFCMLSCFSCARLFATPWTVAYQAPPSMGFSRQECWSGVPSLGTVPGVRHCWVPVPRSGQPSGHQLVDREHLYAACWEGGGQGTPGFTWEPGGPALTWGPQRSAKLRGEE